jgi:hypothetical protein
LPTALPRPRSVARKRPSVFTVLFNTFMVVSALMLAFVVLVREEQYAFPRPEIAPAAEAATAFSIDQARLTQPE